MSWQRTLSFFIFWTLGAIGVAYFFNSSAGWVVLALTCGVILIYRNHQAARVAAWLANTESDPPADVGPWDDLTATLYHQGREQKSLIAELQQTNDAFMSAAMALPIGAITLNKDFQIRWFNPAAETQLHLKGPSDLGQNILNLLRSPEFVSYARQQAWSEPIVLTCASASGDQRIMLRLIPYSTDMLLLMTRDLTQIEKLETTRRDFVANVSHEMRTPLTVLGGFLETLRDAPQGAFTPEQTHHFLTLMHEQSQRMQALVSDLLVLSDLETSTNAEREIVNIPVLIDGARQQVEALSSGKHTFEWFIDPDLKIQGQSAELSSAIANLLTNAVRYTPEGGLITIRWTLNPQRQAVYSVTDTGIGIASEHLPRLSERFYRVDRGRSREVGGTGLGLAITKHIAMRHDAELKVQSQLGHGSTFSLIFDPKRVHLANPQQTAADAA
jgi:two-component system phosphate regulon sensor histidine kinase PhoR